MPKSILEEMGSVLNHKTIEGYPGKRYHAGCEYVDVLETLAIDRMKNCFKQNTRMSSLIQARQLTLLFTFQF